MNDIIDEKGTGGFVKRTRPAFNVASRELRSMVHVFVEIAPCSKMPNLIKENWGEEEYSMKIGGEGGRIGAFLW